MVVVPLSHEQALGLIKIGELSAHLAISISPYQLDKEDVILNVDATVGSIIINLGFFPFVPNFTKKVIFKKVDATLNKVILTPAVGGLIDNLPNYILKQQFQGVELQNIGLNWFVVSTPFTGRFVNVLITGNYTLSNEDQFVFVDVSNGAVAAVLPDAIVNFGKVIVFVKTAGDKHTNVTIQGLNSQLINGASTYVFSNVFGSVSLISNGFNWLVYSVV